jgi:glycerol-3-phosphate dehydrogenase
MPWRGHTLVGTTETLYRGDPAGVRPQPDEIDYLWQTLAHYFPRYRSGERHILDAFAGLRVLPAQGDALFARSRETLLHPDRSGQPRILTIYGGKLTAYRATAAAVMARLRASLPKRSPVADTAQLPLD